ncbi:MAG: lactate utilization protein [Candidatus Ozemobacteraceae bacterium]
MMHPDKLQTLAKKLESNGFEVHIHADRAAAVPVILAKIPTNATIGRTGSATCAALGLYDRLGERGNTIFDPYLPELSDEEKEKIRRRAQQADVLLTGTNAITELGHLVSIDGVGNRVSAQIFGPRQVVIIAGTNKVAADLPAAIKRIKTLACPPNAKRLKLETPCAHDKPCPPPDGCRSPGRMCNATVIHERRPRLTPIRIHLINEDLGF